ncbi:carbamoyltransferase C-terminal domain-containing protein [Paenibacillus kobensis]|uniref:carbamoyltransferase C-terminal domain-containing protein n=1 Tax=Paenibacillus kobensis TaxID=59841 RepID=UPI000FD79047|nr:carbamoyltransferase C-terminal domain-containing protein [Paenibacillus kobensis]
MTEGYYLSVYMHIDPICYFTRSEIRHDQSIALFRVIDGRIELVCCWELERFTGIKQHGQSFYSVKQAKDVIESLLQTLNLSLEDMVEIWGTPQLQTNDSSFLASQTECPYMSYHSLSHLYSAIFLDSSIFYGGSILGLAVDGGPDSVIDRSERLDKNYYAACYVSKGKVRYAPISSPGYIWAEAKNLLGLEEGTLMALASGCTSKFSCEVSPIFISDLSSMMPTRKYIKDIYRQIEEVSSGDARITDWDSRFTEFENKASMTMKIIQQSSICIMENNVEKLIQEFDITPSQTYLAVAGGYALNCPTNSHLMNKYGFKGFIAPPCANDSGLSIGMGLYAFYLKMKLESKQLQFNLPNAFAGVADDGEEAIQMYDEYIVQSSPLQLDQIVEDIMHEPIVWFHGRAELGPRALGNRSILANPASIEAKNHINKIKRREWWRPVAPIILEEEIGNWFEQADSSPYMLRTFQVKPKKRKLIPAALHLDDSARVQTINEVQSPLLYCILSHFKEKTGIPIICNTSLNDKGEPIVNKVREALHFAVTKGIRIIYINSIRYELHNHENYHVSKPRVRQVNMNSFNSEEEEAEALQTVNPYGIPFETLDFYKDVVERINPKESLDASKEQDAQKIIKEVKFYRRLNDYSSGE